MPYTASEYSEAEHRLRDAEALLKMAAGLGRLGAWRVDLADGSLTWSDEVCAIHEVPPGFRCTVDQAIGFYAVEDRPAIQAAFDTCISAGLPFDLELRVVTARGRTVWVRAIGEPERGPDGTVVRVRGAFQDISRQKAAAEANQRLVERITMTLESLTEAFFTLDRQWRFTYLNGEAERVLRRQRDELLGTAIWDQFPLALGSAFEQHYERAMRTGVMAEFEAHYPPLDIWVQVRAYPSVLGLAVSFRDITEKRRAQRQVLRLNADLEERVRTRTAELQAANKSLESFAHSVAHDLRGPLAAINGFAEALEEIEGPGMGERGRRYLDRIRVGARQLDDMTRGLLALACLSQAAVQREHVDVSAIAGEVLATLREQDPDRAVEWVLPETLPAFADRVLLQQVISNLLGNAWKFTAGTAQARIEIGAGAGAQGERVFFVRDNGAGFDMAQARRLFEPFFRVHDASEFPGTGIGLATVQSIVSRHDGRIWAEAAPGRGATFHFTLG